MQESCENCKYWIETEHESFGVKGKRAGYCQKKPPKPTVGSSLKFRFPISAFDDWCGEYEEKKL